MKALKPYEDLLDTHPLLRLVMPLMMGVVFGEWWRQLLVDYISVFVGLTLCSVIVALYITVSRRHHQRKSLPFLLSLNCAMMFLGISLQLMAIRNLEVVWDDVPKYYRGVIVDTPKEKDRVWQTTLKLKGDDVDGKLVRVALMKPDCLNHLVSAESMIAVSGSDSVAASASLPTSKSVAVSSSYSTPSSSSLVLSPSLSNSEVAEKSALVMKADDDIVVVVYGYSLV